MARLSKDQFLKNNLIVFFGSFAISVVNYLYYPVLARAMSLSDFGEVQTLIAIFNNASLIFSAINIVTVVLVSSKKDNERTEQFIIELQKLMVYFVAVFGAITIICAPFLKNFFNFQSAWPFVAMVMALLINIPVVFWNAFLQGRENFVGMNVLGMLAALGKLVMSTVLVYLGFGAFGAIFGLFLGQLLVLLYASRRYKLPMIKKLFSRGLPKRRVLQTEMRYTGLVFLVTLSVALLFSGSTLLVKHYQDPHTAGAYAGIFSIAQIIFFLTMPFAVVLLPSIHTNWERQKSILKKSFLMLSVLGGGTTIVFWVVGDLVVRLLIGPKFLGYEYLLPRLSLAIFLISIANLLFYYLLSVRNLFSLVVAFIGLVVFGGMSFVHHADLGSIVNNLLVSSALTVGLLLVMISLWPRLKERLPRSTRIETLA